MPAYRAPRPTPSSSAISSSSPMPPSGPGPEQATAVARPPLRSSPAHGDPREQPADRQRPRHPHGHLRPVHHHARGASTLGGITGCSGCTVPCTSHCQESEKSPGALTRPPHFGQLGSPLIGPHGPPRPAPRQGRSLTRCAPSDGSVGAPVRRIAPWRNRQSSQVRIISGARRAAGPAGPCRAQPRSWSSGTRPASRRPRSGVIGSSGRNRTGSMGSSSSRSSTRPPGSATRTEVNGAPGHSGSPTSSEAPGATTTPLDLRGRGEHGERAEHLVGVGEPAAYGQDQFGARAPYRVGEHRGGVGHRLRGHAERGVRATMSPVRAETQHLDAVRAEEGDRGAGVRFAERRAQPGLDQSKNFCHAREHRTRISNGQRRDLTIRRLIVLAAGRGSTQKALSELCSAPESRRRTSPLTGDRPEEVGLRWIEVDRAVPTALPH